MPKTVNTLSCLLFCNKYYLICDKSLANIPQIFLHLPYQYFIIFNMSEIKIEIESSTPTPPPPPQRKLEVPEWAQAIKRKYLSQNVSQFILHGNINEYIPLKEDGKPKYMKVKDFLNDEMFKYYDIIVHYDRAMGIRFRDDMQFGGAGKMRNHFKTTLETFDQVSGNSFASLASDSSPERAFLALNAYFMLCFNKEFVNYMISYLDKKEKPKTQIETSSVTKKMGSWFDEAEQKLIDGHIGHLLKYMDDSEKGNKNTTKEAALKVDDAQRLANFLKESLSKPKRVALIIEYAETLIPMSEANNAKNDERLSLIFLQKWATDERFKSPNMITCILTENISEINQQYVKNPYTYEVLIPYPEEEDRLAFIQNFLQERPDAAQYFEMPPEVLAKNTAGLKLVQLKILLAEAAENKIMFTNKELVFKKKEMIESESGGLLEFIQTKYNLANVAGHAYAKKNLMEAATALKAGRPDVMPMGYLVSGPVGTGKTYMISCFANDIGVPMVMLKNFRSQWQGATEGNLEKVLKILKAMSPVAVMIDEADAYLGNRSASGDSGVSSRVFSMIATFMSNTENRGKVIWFLITARPDLLPVDFKRQGRAEEHIALFYPETLEEKKELLQVVVKKTDLEYMNLDEFDEEFFEDMTVKSGADMEAALTRAKFKAASLGLEKVTFDIVAQVFGDFLPPTYPEEIELMNYAAILECTSKELLPLRFRDMPRSEVLAKVEELKALRR